MKGTDLKNWRKGHNYNQETLMLELGIKSRQTISTWENSEEELPQILKLALLALEHYPPSRRFHGRQMNAAERKHLAQLEHSSKVTD